MLTPKLWIAVFLVISPLVGYANEPVRLRVLTYNIHHGQGTDGRFDLPRLARVIRSVEPDLVALQEVDKKTKRSSGIDQAAELSRLTGMQSYFAKAMDYSGGEYGEAVLSRWAPLQTKAIALPADKGFEPRSAAAVRVQPTKGPPVWFAGTHLDHTQLDKQRMMQVRSLTDQLDELDEPIVLVGDLNADPDSRPIRQLLEHFADVAANNPERTYPADRPRLRIDWILVRPAERWRVVEVRTIDERVASDHRPLLAVLEWIGEAAGEPADDRGDTR